jgi:hypothetical protein
MMGPVAQPASDSKIASGIHRNGSFPNKLLSLGLFSYFEGERIPKTGTDLFKKIRGVIDSDKQQNRFILTASNSPEITV